MSVAVTGATGFLGGHLVDRLQHAHLHDEGEPVLALARPSSRTSRLDRQGVPVRRFDRQDASSVRAALDGVRVLVHCAGGGKVHSLDELRHNNATLTEELLEAALAAGVERLVLVSSLSAAGPSRPGVARTEGDEPAPVSMYGKAKREAEDLCQAAKDRIHVVVARPPVVYGPRDDRFLPLVRAAKRGLVPLPPGRELSVIFGPDCAAGLARCASADVPSGATYFLTHRRVLAWKDVAEALARSFGHPPRTFTPPKPVLGLGALASEAFGRLTGRQTPFNRDKWRDGQQDCWACDATLAERELGFVAPTDLEEGLAATVSSYRGAGWV